MKDDVESKDSQGIINIHNRSVTDSINEEELVAGSSEVIKISDNIMD